LQKTEVAYVNDNLLRHVTGDDGRKTINIISVSLRSTVNEKQQWQLVAPIHFINLNTVLNCIIIIEQKQMTIN